MTVYLLTVKELDDYDHVYGIFSSIEKARNAQQEYSRNALITCAEIEEYGLDEVCVPR